MKVYESMRPRDAASIFDVLDMHVLLEVLDRMNDRKAAAILAAMQPERARMATQMLAQNAPPAGHDRFLCLRRRTTALRKHSITAIGDRSHDNRQIDERPDRGRLQDDADGSSVIFFKQIDFNNVEEATDGTEALSKLKTGHYGLVISDWNMQPMTGLQLLTEVRQDREAEERCRSS